MSEACEDRDGRAGGATMLQPVILRFTLNAAAFAAARPTLLFKPLYNAARRGSAHRSVKFAPESGHPLPLKAKASVR